MGVYLSPVWHTLHEAYRSEFGYIDSIQRGGVQAGITRGHAWMLDNGMYSGRWTRDRWIAQLEFYAPYQDTCIGVVVPDYLERTPDGVRGDWQKTLSLFWQHLDTVRQYGYRVAFVCQDGQPVNMVPWHDIDVIFVGGSNDYKLRQSAGVIDAARKMGKHVHIGRVNSEKRILRFWMADSWDGTMLKSEPSLARQTLIINAARMATALKERQHRLL